MNDSRRCSPSFCPDLVPKVWGAKGPEIWRMPGWISFCHGWKEYSPYRLMTLGMSFAPVPLSSQLGASASLTLSMSIVTYGKNSAVLTQQDRVIFPTGSCHIVMILRNITYSRIKPPWNPWKPSPWEGSLHKTKIERNLQCPEANFKN